MDLNISWDLWLALLSFQLIGLLAWWTNGLQDHVKQRTAQDWFLDLQGLFVQGWLVPLAKMYGLMTVLAYGLPTWKGQWQAPAWFSFGIAFVLVDYTYYWNHRLLHKRQLWSLHRVHHATQTLDLLSSARNSLVTPLFLVYIWVHTFFAYVLADPIPYILGASLTAILDLWRHSPSLGFKGKWEHFVSRILVTPTLHAWHHSKRGMNKNFGANLSLWDRWHGTFERGTRENIRYGWNEKKAIWRQWLRPWSI